MGPPTGSAELNTSLPSYGRKSRAPMTVDQAREITGRIYTLLANLKVGAAELATLIEEARAGKVWLALSYTSWDEYCRAQFDIGEKRAAQLLAKAEWDRNLAEAAGISTKVEIPEHTTRAVGKKHMADVVEVVRACVSDDMPDWERKAVIRSTLDEYRPPKRERKGSGPDGWDDDQWAKFGDKHLAAFKTLLEADLLEAEGTYTPPPMVGVVKVLSGNGENDWDEDLAVLTGSSEDAERQVRAAQTTKDVVGEVVSDHHHRKRAPLPVQVFSTAVETDRILRRWDRLIADDRFTKAADAKRYLLVNTMETMAKVSHQIGVHLGVRTESDDPELVSRRIVTVKDMGLRFILDAGALNLVADDLAVELAGDTDTDWAQILDEAISALQAMRNGVGVLR